MLCVASQSYYFDFESKKLAKLETQSGYTGLQVYNYISSTWLRITNQIKLACENQNVYENNTYIYLIFWRFHILDSIYFIMCEIK